MSSTSTSRPTGCMCNLPIKRKGKYKHCMQKKITQQSAKYGINHISANKKDGIDYPASCDVVKILC